MIDLIKVMNKAVDSIKNIEDLEPVEVSITMPVKEDFKVIEIRWICKEWLTDEEIQALHPIGYKELISKEDPEKYLLNECDKTRELFIKDVKKKKQKIRDRFIADLAGVPYQDEHNE